MGRLLQVALAALVLAPAAQAATRQEVTIASADGTRLAATLSLPSAAAPAGGWPAIVLMHGVGGDRSSMTTLAARAGFVGEQYAVLAFDARGHGESGGLIGVGGPNEVADARAVFDWLAARPDVADARIGVFGISYGGGIALNSLAAGVPWAAVEAAEAWSDLVAALLPQGLPRTGVIQGFLAGLPLAKLDPAVLGIRDAAVDGTNVPAARAWAAQRSSLARLAGSRTPVFLMPGRRDFAFGVDQAKRLYAVLRGPKRLWIGNHGHSPSSFPAADSTKMLAEGKEWFDRFLRRVPNAIELRRPVTLAAEGRAATRTFTRLPATTSTVSVGRLGRTIVPAGKALIRTPKVGRAVEVFGAPTVTLTATARGGWPRIVAVLVARTPGGGQIVVSTGGVPARAGARTYSIRLADHATAVPKGSFFEVTVATSTLAQSPFNTVYLDPPVPPAARLTIGRVQVSVPLLR